MNAQLDELHRLRAELEAAELRLKEAEMAIERVGEEVRRARLTITLVLESTKDVPVLDTGSPWVLPGGAIS